MALQSSGAIKLSEIASQFGGTAPHSLKDYYRNGTEGVPDNVLTASIPTTGAIGLKDFYSSADTQTRDIRGWMSYQFNENGYGVTSQSSTAQPASISATYNAIAWQPVFRAGTGFITSASFRVGHNEDTPANSEHVLFYGGLTSSTVTNLIYRWDAGTNGDHGGHRWYTLTWNGDGTINSITQTSQSSPNPYIISFVTNNTTAANQAGYVWFGFRIKNPSSWSKGGQILIGDFYSNNSAATQPT